EIESHLRQHPAVREAAAGARPAPAGGNRLVAWIVPAQAGPLPQEELRSWLKERLPDPMVPSIFVALAELPLTTNAKIDRAALPEPEVLRPELDGSFVAPRTKEEELLATIWAKVLNVEQVSVEDNFFALGGDSILSIQATSLAYRAGLRVTPRQFFENPTIAALARVADRSPALLEDAGPVVGPVPLTPIQRQFFASEPRQPEGFTLPLFLETKRDLDPG